MCFVELYIILLLSYNDRTKDKRSLTLMEVSKQGAESEVIQKLGNSVLHAANTSILELVVKSYANIKNTLHL